MTDLERFFHHIVRNLAATDPARLHRPLPLIDILQSIVPYRTSRRVLELESSEDYELVLMRLCAGEGGLARAEPEEIRAEFEEEVKGRNPDLGLLRRHEGAVICLDPESVTNALDPKPDLAFAPPDYRTELPPDEYPVPSIPELPAPHGFESETRSSSREHRGSIRCSRCKGPLPSDRIVNFCPHCGQSQVLTSCPVCQGEVEAGWRHCISCGFMIGAPPA